MANRLQLNFKLTTMEERSAFLGQYLTQQQFLDKPPTADELETMGNYVLWGKDEHGLNAKQSGLVDLITKHGTWDKSTTASTESLEGLMELPTFNEAALSTYDAIPIKVRKETFSREEALRDCPPYLIPTYTDLFRQIDELDLRLNLYDEKHGRRKNPPRPQLLALFTPTEIEQAREEISHWPQYRYLRMRHQLVDLRRQQYTIRDSYQQTLLPEATIVPPTPYSDPQLNADIPVFPLGCAGTNNASRLIFLPFDKINPTNYTNEEMRAVSSLLWQKKDSTPELFQMFIDFRELEHVYQLIMQYGNLRAAANVAEMESGLPVVLRTLRYYIREAKLTDLERDLLARKINKEKNADIAAAINCKWHKSYTDNYISTIFRQRIIPKINAAAIYHEKLVSNIFFEENFKKCASCGRILLLDADNFTRKSRSRDGFAPKCKECQKLAH